MPKKTPRQGTSAKKKEDGWLMDDVKVKTGLPPQVDGQIRCFCKVSVSQVVWTIAKPPDLALVRVKWWGEEGDGVLFRPLDVKKGNKSQSRTTARYPVRSGPCQFATYLNDMGSLTLDLLTGPGSDVIGQATVTQVGLLTNTRPINGFFPVISTTGQKLANLQVSLVLEPLMASYDSHGSIPTSDLNMDNARRSHDSMVVPEASHPLPYSELPTKPDNTVFISPSAQMNDGHRGQTAVSRAHYTDDIRQQLNYGLPTSNNPDSYYQPNSGAVAITTNGHVVTLPDSRVTDSRGVSNPSNVNNSNVSRQRGSPSKAASSGNNDLLSVLVEKGTKLREAMIVSSMHSDLNSRPVGTSAKSKTDLMKSPTSARAAGSVMMSDAFAASSGFSVDHLMTSPVRNQDFQLYNLMNGLSPGTSISTDLGYDPMLSEPEDPMHENSILHQLFYYNSDNEALDFSDISGYGNHLYQHSKQAQGQPMSADHFMSAQPRLLGGSGGFGAVGNPLEEPGNQRPPSRASSLTSLNIEEDEFGKKEKTKRKARSRSRSGSRSRSRSNSKTRSRSNTPSKTTKALKTDEKENTATLSKDTKISKLKKKVRSRSSSRSRSRSRSARRKRNVDEASDSDQMNSSRSSKVSFDPVASEGNKINQNGLSVERLTLLGRVHVARVNIDSLQMLKSESLDLSDSKLSVGKLKSGKPPRPLKSKKTCTYFVEYQFPVVATSKDKYTPNAMATEVTRVASKNVKNGVLSFKHRSVFPIMFDGAAIEKWWKSALVFRLYCKEPRQHTPTLIGSGGISLKSILRSENLCVQREIEIPDTSKNGLLNSSKSSSFNSSLNSRSSANLFGSLKVSVELASDHKEFATVMARTKLAEMSGNVKIVPVGGVNPEQARLVEQLNRNKDQPIVKSPSKKIDLPVTSSQPSTSGAVTGLPPQSPRRKPQESAQIEAEDEGDEISRLKQQLKATLAVLSNPNSQKSGATSHLDSGAQIFGGQGLEPVTLHTLLIIQEGRNISTNGVPALHMVNKRPGLMQPQTSDSRDSVARNTYLVCRMFWCNDAVHSNVCWGTSNPEFNFIQVAPVLMTTSLLERLRDNYMIVEVWDKKVTSESDKLIGMVKLSLHQFYLSFRERKIANALLKSEYPVMAVDNYMPIVDLFSGLHFGQLKVVLAMGSEQQVATLQRLALDSTGMEPVPQKPASYLERQDLIRGGALGDSSGRVVEHQFEIIIDGVRGLKLFESMIWGEADCFVQFFFPSEGEGKEDELVTVKSLPTMKCFRTATTLCIPDPTFHDTSRHKLTLPVGTPVQRELLTACANSGGGVSGLPFEVWCRYYHPNVRDQLIAKCTLPLAKLCAMITMHKKGEACVQSFSLRLSQVGVDGQENAEAMAKFKDAGVLDVTVNYRCQAVQSESAMTAANRNQDGSQVCLSVGIIRASGLKAAADYMAQLDSTMAYPADIGVNSYVRIKISFLGKENERITKTVARSFAPEFSHYMDFPCLILMSHAMAADATSLAELLESAEAVFEVWHQVPTGLPKEYRAEKITSGMSGRRLAHHTGDILLGTTIVPLMSLLTKRTGLNGWFAINLPYMGWTKPADSSDVQHGTALDQVVGGLELSLRFAHQEDRDRVVSVARSIGWSPIDLEVEQPDWQDEDSHHNVHNVTVSVDQVSFPVASALQTGNSDLDPSARCYVRYKFYDKGAVVSKCRKLHAADSGSLLSSLSHKHHFVLSHTAPLQWYLREEKLEIQAWVTYGRGREGEKKPRQRDKLVGSCYIDLDSLTDMRRRQQRISGLFPLFKPGTNNLKAAFIRAHITSRVSSSAKEETSDNELALNGLDESQSASESDQSSDSIQQFVRDFGINKSPKKKRGKEDGKDPATSFGVLLAVERAMHLPKVTERNRSGEINPTTYVSYQSAERSKPTCSSIFPNSTNPVWDYAVETRLSTEYLFKENKNLILKVWHKPSDAAKTPDKSSDRVLGFVSVDLTSLLKGLQQICGWYNIMDFNGQCRGQIKVSITPQDLPGRGPTGGTPSSSFVLPSFGVSSMSTNTQEVASSIAQQLMNLQQQVMQRMGSLTSQHSQVFGAAGASTSQELDSTADSAVKEQDSSIANTTTTSHWQPKFMVETTKTDDPSKSYLFSSLRRQLQDLDSITQRLKTRLSSPAMEGDTSQHQLNSARSGEILNGTHSGLSTIHTASSLMNTRESSSPSRYNASSFEVGTSQESARSHTMNNSSLENRSLNAAPKVDDANGNHGRKLLDSGVFSAKNFSDKSGEDAPDSHRSERNAMAAGTNSDTLSTPPSSQSDTLHPAAVGTLEAGFLNVAAVRTQTLLPTVDNSESSGNSHGFVPGTQRSMATESFSIRGLDKGRGSKSGTSSSAGASKSGSKHSHSGSGSARSEKNTIEERVENEDDDDEEEVTDEEEEDEGQRSGRYGSYHRYRDLLDAEEDDGDEEEKEDNEADVVEIIPRSLNNMSTVLALGASGENNNWQPTEEKGVKYTTSAEDKDVAHAGTELERLSFSPASPNVNAHEGTSVWCSDDNEDSFFQQVFERNKHMMKEKEDLDVDSWLQDQEEDAKHGLLENWLEAQSMDRTKGDDGNDNGHKEDDEEEKEDESDDEKEDTLKHDDSYEEFGFIEHENQGKERKEREKEDEEEEITPRQHKRLSEEDMRLELDHDSDHDSQGDTHREKGATDVWNQNIGNSSDEETARNMWTKKQTVNDFFDEQEEETTSKLQDLHLQDGEIDGEMDQVTDLPSHFSNAPPSMLSNVELIDSITSSARNNQTLHSTLSSTSGKNDKTLHSTLSSTSAPNGQTLHSTFSEVSSLPSNQRTVEDYPFTLELAETQGQQHQHTSHHGEGARPKVRHLLSNVDLDSNGSSQRPNSGSSHGSRASGRSNHSSHGSKTNSKSKSNSVKSGASSGKGSVSSEKSGNQAGNSSVKPSQNSTSNNEMHQFNGQENEIPDLEGASHMEKSSHMMKNSCLSNGPQATNTHHKPGHNDRDSTLDSAYIEGDYSDIHSNHPNSIMMVNGAHSSHEDLTPEDSGLGHPRDRTHSERTVDESDSGLPNFFMATEDMQASIKALQMATSAASNVNQDDVRSQNKVKAVSELVNKIAASKPKVASLSVKNKQPPSAEEAKRIAKIFSSKMS